MIKTSILLLAVLLFGCANTNQRGNFLLPDADAISKQLALDSMKKIEALYPPGNTRLNFKHSASDSFGALLVSMLRDKGYAVSEYDPTQTTTNGLDVSYVVDTMVTLYRVSIFIGTNSITRAYTATNSAITPASSWSHKE